MSSSTFSPAIAANGVSISGSEDAPAVGFVVEGN
jgi:hypothetical protein